MRDKGITAKSTEVSFTLDEVIQSARAILAAEPDPVIAYRLLREVLRVPACEPLLVEAEKAARHNRWVRQLEEAQMSDGSWGRFHSRDTKVKTAVRTTEEAIDQAFALGIQPDGIMFTRTRQYILDVLHGKAHITDRTEKSESWPLVIKLILSGRLAQLDPLAQELDFYAAYLEDVAEIAFRSGSYKLEDEASAHFELSGIHVPQGFLESWHALWILSSRPLPAWLEPKLVDWVWRKTDGIRYLRATLSEIEPWKIGYWIRSQNILSRFPSWREAAQVLFNHLWEQRGEDGLWDFGRNIAHISEFPISESWRKPITRKQDYSTCLLVLFRKFFD